MNLISHILSNIRKHTLRRRTLRIDTPPHAVCKGPIWLSGHVGNGVRQLCMMQLSSKRRQLSKHQGEVFRFSCITSSSSSKLEHHYHIGKEFKAWCDVVVQFKRAEQKTCMPTVTVKGCGTPLAAHAVIWFETRQSHCGCRWLWDWKLALFNHERWWSSRGAAVEKQPANTHNMCTHPRGADEGTQRAFTAGV